MARNEVPLNIPHRVSKVHASDYLRATVLFTSVKDKTKQVLRIRDFDRTDTQGVDDWHESQREEAREFNSYHPGNEIKVNVNCFTCWS